YLSSLFLIRYSPNLTLPHVSPLFPYTTLFRSSLPERRPCYRLAPQRGGRPLRQKRRDAQASSGRSSSRIALSTWRCSSMKGVLRSEEHTSELQSRENLVCRLLLEKKKKHI